jgi:hypothetical protein
MREHPVQAALRGGTIRLTLPAKVASDLGALQRGLRQLAERLGHPQCATGCDVLHLGLEREFRLDAKVELNPQPLPPGPLQMGPGWPVPWHGVRVSVPTAVLGDIDKLTGTIAAVLGRLGCAACCSGFDIEFMREFDHFAVDEKLGVVGFGSFR